MTPDFDVSFVSKPRGPTMPAFHRIERLKRVLLYFSMRLVLLFRRNSLVTRRAARLVKGHDSSPLQPIRAATDELKDNEIYYFAVNLGSCRFRDPDWLIKRIVSSV